MLKVGVLYGGASPEREVSLKSGQVVLDSLDRTRYEILAFDTGQRESIQRLIESPPDVAFLALHGQYGEDGTIQGLLELLHVPYTGSDVFSSALSIDKIESKYYYQKHGIPTPEFEIHEKNTWKQQGFVSRFESVQNPLVVKPARVGSSVGIRIVNNLQELQNAIYQAFDFCPQVLVEPCISGVELTVGVVGGTQLQPLPVVEIIPPTGFFDYEAKYTPGATQEIVPARISQETTQRAQKLAIQAHQALKCWGVSRTDMFLTPAGELLVLETNTCPGLTDTSLLPQAARAAGMNLSDLFDRMLGSALERQELLVIANRNCLKESS